MTNKEALDELAWFINCVIDAVENGDAAYLKDEVKLASNAYNKLEKNLEVLELLKKEMFNEDKFFNLENGWYDDSFSFSKDEQKKVEEWLENE